MSACEEKSAKVTCVEVPNMSPGTQEALNKCQMSPFVPFPNEELFHVVILPWIQECPCGSMIRMQL